MSDLTAIASSGRKHAPRSAAWARTWLGALLLASVAAIGEPGSIAQQGTLVSVTERSSLEELPDEERRAWLEALTYYRESLAERSHFDDEMWPEHDRANRDWIASVLPSLRKHESGFVELTSRIYGADWPDERFRADASAYANWAGGHTAFGRINDRLQGPG